MTSPSPRSEARRGLPVRFDVEERATSVFVPESLLASQYFERLSRRGHLSGERRLMYAIIADAVDVYLQYATSADPRRRALAAEATRWIESDDRSRLYAFGTICDHLGLDAGYLRRGLRRRRMQACEHYARRASGHQAALEHRLASNE